jgi:putative acetyltransferase
MPEPTEITIRPFQPADQEAVKQLVLAGLVEHWGWLDPARNPDLDDIAHSYQAALFLVACREEEIIGAGALRPHAPGVGEIVRMSVSANHRRQGVGSLILGRLLAHAPHLGYHTVILETTAAWKEVVNFYLRSGFRITHYRGDDVYFSLPLRDFPYPGAEFPP